MSTHNRTAFVNDIEFQHQNMMRDISSISSQQSNSRHAFLNSTGASSAFLNIGGAAFMNLGRPLGYVQVPSFSVSRGDTRS